jgi:hypothetical protein
MTTARAIAEENQPSMDVREVRVDSITVGERTRKDYGDLQELADSIAEFGLLQPIGITPEHVLVFGERRLRAVRDILGWDTIEAKVVPLEAIVLGEFHENMRRKDFTVSERVDIGKRLEEYLGNRQGQRTDKELPQNFVEVEAAKETREIAAEKAGFGNRTSYVQAKHVVERGTPELVEAMDQGQISIALAADLLNQPASVQREIVKNAEHVPDGRITRTIASDYIVAEQWKASQPEREAKRHARREEDELREEFLAKRIRRWNEDIARALDLVASVLAEMEAVRDDWRAEVPSPVSFEVLEGIRRFKRIADRLAERLEL